MAADRSISAIDMPLIVHRALIQVAQICVPLSLVSQGSAAGTLLRFIDNVNYVRVPNAPVLDATMLDIDPMLGEAVVYAACMISSANKKADFRAFMMDAISKYNWAIYEGETNVLHDTDCSE
jgi:hypothetical protein